MSHGSATPYAPAPLDWEAFQRRVGIPFEGMPVIAPRDTVGLIWGESAAARACRARLGDTTVDTRVPLVTRYCAPNVLAYGTNGPAIEAVAAWIARHGVPTVATPVADVLDLLRLCRVPPEVRMAYLTAWITQCTRVHVEPFRPPTRLYHVTWARALPGILAGGLRTAHAGDNVGTYASEAVFCTTDPDAANLPAALAEAFRDSEAQQAVAILEIDARQLTPASFCIDDDVRNAPSWGEDDFPALHEAILRSVVLQAHADREALEAATGVCEPLWHLSRRVMKTIAVAADIPARAITHVRLAHQPATASRPFTESAVADLVYAGDPRLGFRSRAAWHLYRDACRRGDPRPPAFLAPLSAVPPAPGRMAHVLTYEPLRPHPADTQVDLWICVALPPDRCPPVPSAFQQALRDLRRAALLLEALPDDAAPSADASLNVVLPALDAAVRAQGRWVAALAAQLAPTSRAAHDALMAVAPVAEDGITAPRLRHSHGAPPSAQPLVAWLDGERDGYPVLAVRVPGEEHRSSSTWLLRHLAEAVPGARLAEPVPRALTHSYSLACRRLASLDIHTAPPIGIPAGHAAPRGPRDGSGARPTGR